VLAAGCAPRLDPQAVTACAVARADFH
jgi:hypothetical protein